MTASAVQRGLNVRAATYVGVFLVTLATLMYEIALTRIFSVTMWYHFAFVAVSVALFGMTVGALAVHLLPHRFRHEDVKRQLWLFSLLFALAIAGCFVIQLFIPFTPHFTVGGMASVVATCVVISIPFVFSGVVVCLALTRFPDRVNRLYAADLVGAAIGCVALLVLFRWFDGPSLIILIGAIAAVGAFVFATDARSRRGLALASVIVIGLAGFAVVNSSRQSEGKALLKVRWTKETRDPRHDFERWNAFSRLTVDGDANASEQGMLIDSTAGTGLVRYRGNPSETRGLRDNISNLAHNIRHRADVMVVGVGGGRDVLSALQFDQRSVTGVEINPDILDITNHVYGDYTGHLDRDPRVHFVNDEARSYLARTDRKYDIIQISLIDTWAATSAGAFALTENSLYTTQAWRIFLDRLKPGGVLSVSRWYGRGYLDTSKPLEAYRTTALAAQALTERGVNKPRDHMLTYRGVPGIFGETVATTLVSPQRFSASDEQTLAGEAQRRGLAPVLTPDKAIDPNFAALAAPGGPAKAVRSFKEDISPPTDDRPFFFQMANLRTAFSRRVLDNNPTTRPVLVLALLAVTVVALAASCIGLPLLAGRRAFRQRGGHRRWAPFYTYFAGIGFGFLLVEISQLQRLSTFLGQPTYALAVVLFSVLLFSGIGSMLTERIVRPDQPRSVLAPLAVLLVVVAVFGVLTPVVIRAMASATTPVRIATAVGILMPLGLMMGMPFSIGMRAAARHDGAPTAFLWGINGATSVCASVFGVVIALFFGISMSLWTGLFAYAVAFVSMIAITRLAPTTTEEPAPAPEPPVRQPAAALVGGGR